MKKLERPKSRYQLLREQEEAYVRVRWAKGKTVLKWTSREPIASVDEQIHDLGFTGEEPWYHTPFQICRPDLLFGGKRCDKHQLELDELVATSPPVQPIADDEDRAFHQIHDETIETSEQTIRQEFARKGILVLTPRPSRDDDHDDDPMTTVTDGNQDRPTVYTTIDAETIGLIELEKKMYLAGPVRSIIRKGERLQMRGYEDLHIDDQKEAAKQYLRYYKSHAAPDPKRANAQRQLTQKLNEQGKKATIFRLYGLEEVPAEYFEVDEDPNRFELHETDMDAHDVHAIVEPKDPEADPTIHTLTPSDYDIRFFLRGHSVPWLGENDAYERNQTLRNFLAAHSLHVGSYISPALTGDHDMAESEWDLGVDLNEADPIDPEWILELIEVASSSNTQKLQPVGM